MATFVQVGHLAILIDPGATLAANRYGLPPADEEWEALRRANDRISAYALRADLVFVSHYHEDHFRSDPSSYAGRLAVLKDPRRMVQGLQARRALELWKALPGRARIESADGWARREPPVRLEASAPLAHGLEGTALGYVVALTVVDEAERERFVFASDVQGPLSPVVAAWLVRQRPTLLYLSGAPSYVEREVGAEVVQRGVENLRRVIDATGCRVILDHHALRDLRWRERFADLFATGRVTTAAGHLGLADATLEAGRQRLWTHARRPAARVASPRAIMASRSPSRTASRSAKGGITE
ncbi:MAG: MBL fold metallo-hydrolase [Candidatus Rokuibacteriota bacterium]